LERARRLLKDSGYDGRPIVVLDPTDSPYAHGPALVTAEMLRSLGATVDLQAMDWSTMVQRRAKKETPAQGGWNVFHTWSTAFDTMTPAVSSVLGGAGEKAWFGWPTSEPIEKLRAQFTRELDAAKRKAIAEEVQKIAYDEVLYVPWGQFVVSGASRARRQTAATGSWRRARGPGCRSGKWLQHALRLSGSPATARSGLTAELAEEEERAAAGLWPRHTEYP